MKATKITRHQIEVADLIESIGDEEIQLEMKEISANYSQALAGLQMAKQYLGQIEEETGMEHLELQKQISDTIRHTKACHIGLLEMISNF